MNGIMQGGQGIIIPITQWELDALYEYYTNILPRYEEWELNEVVRKYKDRQKSK